MGQNREIVLLAAKKITREIFPPIGRVASYLTQLTKRVLQRAGPKQEAKQQSCAGSYPQTGKTRQRCASGFTLGYREHQNRSRGDAVGRESFRIKIEHRAQQRSKIG